MYDVYIDTAYFNCTWYTAAVLLLSKKKCSPMVYLGTIRTAAVGMIYYDSITPGMVLHSIYWCMYTIIRATEVGRVSCPNLAGPRCVTLSGLWNRQVLGNHEKSRIARFWFVRECRWKCWNTTPAGHNRQNTKNNKNVITPNFLSQVPSQLSGTLSNAYCCKYHTYVVWDILPEIVKFFSDTSKGGGAA